MESLRNAYLQAATFVGRTAELDILQDNLRQVVAGDSRCTLICGEAGIGKSRLVNELRPFALLKGALVLRGQAVQTNARPYQLWREIIHRLTLMTTLSDDEAQNALQNALSQTATSEDEPGAQRIIQPEKLAELLTEAVMRQKQPFLFILEDLHQAAGESLDLLSLLLNRLEQLPSVFVIGTYRPDEMGDLPEALQQATHITLNRLQTDDLQRLSYSMLGEMNADAQMVDFIERETEGNTFFIVEVIRTLAESAGSLRDIATVTLPRSLLAEGMQNVIRRRIALLPPESHQLLYYAAIQGRIIDRELLYELADEEAVHRWLYRAEQAAILDVQDNQWRFQHDKIREAVLHEMDEDTRKRYHRDIAEAMIACYGEDIDYAYAIAMHWFAADNPHQAIPYAARASSHLLDIGHTLELHALIKQALPHTPPGKDRIRLLISRAKVARRMGDPHLTIEQARQAGEEASEAEWVYGQIDAMRTLHHGYYAVGEYDDAEKIADQVIEMGYAADILRPVIAMLRMKSAIARRRGHLDKAEQYITEAMGLTAKAPGTEEAYAMCLVTRGLLKSQKQPGSGIDDLKQALAVFRQTRFMNGILSCLQNMSAIYIEAGNPQAAKPVLEEALQIAHRINKPENVIMAHLNLGTVYNAEDNHEEAIKQYEFALPVARRIQSKNLIAYIHLNHAHSLHAPGQHQAARQHHRAAIEQFQAMNMIHQVAWAHLQQAQTALEHDAPAEAVLYLCDAWTIASENHYEELVRRAGVYMAWVYFQNDEVSSAETMLSVIHRETPDDDTSTAHYINDLVNECGLSTEVSTSVSMSEAIRDFFQTYHPDC
jgi:tetratricopeptide (TPR) repeat protein